MPLRKIGTSLGFPKRRVVSLLPEPWTFDHDHAPRGYNRWQIESISGRKVTVRHVATRKRVQLNREQIQGAQGPNLLVLAVQIALYQGIIQLLPLPPGYWGS